MTTFIYLPGSDGGRSPYWEDAVGSFSSLPSTGTTTGSVILVLDTASLYYWNGAAWVLFVDGVADVSGPASSTTNAVARFTDATGKVLKNSVILVSDTGAITGVASIVASGAISAGSATLGAALPVASGGTNSQTALNNSRIIVSSGGAIVENAAITGSRALVSSAGGIPVAATTTTTEIGYVNGVTAAIQTQLDSKTAGAASSTDNALARFDGTTGKIVQNSLGILDDSGNLSGLVQVNATLAKVGAAGALTSGAVFEIASTAAVFLPPRMTTTQRNAIVSPPEGGMVYDTTLRRFYGFFDGAWGALHGWGDPA